MKKEYTKPAMRVVKLQQQRMLCGSPYNNIQSPVETYDDNDVIDQKGNIW